MSGYTYPGKKPAKRNLALEEHEREVTANPEYYVVSIFRGVGKFERRKCATLELAREAAEELLHTCPSGQRPAAIYAVKGPRDVLIELVHPQKKGAPNGPLGSRART